MVNIQDRILLFLDSLDISDREISAKIGLSHGYLAALRKGSKMGLDKLEKILDTFRDQINLLWVLTGEGSMLDPVAAYEESDQVGLQEPVLPYVITKDQSDRSTIPFISKKEIEAYQKHYQDVAFLASLPTFGIPGYETGTYRAFEVPDDAMNRYVPNMGISESSWIIGEWVENWQRLEKNKVYVLLSTDGVLIGRCYNDLETDGVIICQNYTTSGDFTETRLKEEMIREVWKSRTIITHQDSPNAGVYQAILDLQAEVAELKKRMK